MLKNYYNIFFIIYIVGMTMITILSIRKFLRTIMVTTVYPAVKKTKNFSQ